VRRILGLGVLAALLAAPLSGCVVKERDRLVTCSSQYTGCVWVQPYNDAAGRLHPAHWRCPGTVDAL
jgi:hypothetical protein